MNKYIKYKPTSKKINSFVLPSFISGKKYYLYAHTRCDNGEVFYFGVGTMDRNKNYYRAVDDKKRSDLWKRITNKTKYNVLIIQDSDTRKDVLDREIQYVTLMGKIKDKKGPLANLTDGGDGCKGNPIVWTTEMRKAASERMKIRETKESTREKLRQNIYNSTLVGRKGADSYIAKTTYQINPNDNNIINTFVSIKEAADFMKVSHQSIQQAIKRNKKSKGYFWRN